MSDSKIELQDIGCWAGTLRFLRLCHYGKTGDSFEVKLIYSDEAELQGILRCLRVNLTSAPDLASGWPFSTFGIVSSADCQWSKYADSPLHIGVRYFIDDPDNEEIGFANFNLAIRGDHVRLSLPAWSGREANESDFRNACYLDKLVEPCAAKVIDPLQD